MSVQRAPKELSTSSQEAPGTYIDNSKTNIDKARGPNNESSYKVSKKSMDKKTAGALLRFILLLWPLAGWKKVLNDL